MARGRHGLTLTPAGEHLLVRASRLLIINDDIWATMTSPHFSGEVTLGVPADIVRTYVPAILRRFNSAWPQIRVTLVCDASERLIAGVDAGDVDLALTTELGCGDRGEALASKPLVWVGANGGTAWTLDPIPIATGDAKCPFRAIALKALADGGRVWQSVCEVSSFEPICANVEADLAVAPLLASTVPTGMQILDEKNSGLPPLPDVSLNLYLPVFGASDAAVELARHIRAGFVKDEGPADRTEKVGDKAAGVTST
jgi:DNA-binding transcriptional LysR family regulator